MAKKRIVRIQVKVYIIILNYKGWQDAIECLKSVFASGYNNFTVVLIDNDSRDHSLDHIRSWASQNIPDIQESAELEIASEAIELKPRLNSKLLLLQNDSNRGFAGGINPVLEILRGEDGYIWLLNPDMEVQPDTLGALVQFASKQKGPCIIGGVIKYFTNRETLFAIGGGKVNFRSATISLNKKHDGDLDYISGGCLFTSTKTFMDAGLLPEQYFLYWEETDFCFSAKQRGFRLLVAQDAVCYDKISRSIGKNYLSDFYYSRNGLIFLNKYRPAALGTAMLFMWVRILKRLLNGRFNRAKGIYNGMRDFTKHQRNANK